MSETINSCVGCKYLYSIGIGYSNYTWEDTEVECAKDKNPNLAASKPFDWNHDAEKDNWSATNASRCSLYESGVFVELDVDGYDGPADNRDDEDQILAICEHSGRDRNGYAG